MIEIDKQLASAIILSAREDLKMKPLISTSNSGQQKRAAKNRERYRDEAASFFRSKMLDDLCKIIDINASNIRKRLNES